MEGIVTRLAIINADGSGLVVLDAAGDSAAFPSWSPDGTKLVYTAAMPREQRGLRIIDLATNTVTTLTTGPDSFPTWSPPLGDRIVFTRSPHSILGAAQLYSVKPDGTDLERLTFTPGAQDAHAAFSLDGRWIAFTSTRVNPRVQPIATEGSPHDGGQIFVMRADGSDVRQLIDAHHNGSPAWMLLPAD